MTRWTSLDAFRSDLADLPDADTDARAAAEARQAGLTKPPGSLGRLEDIAVFLAGWQGNARPMIDRAQALVFAGNHGVCAQGVNPFPQEVTTLMVANFEAGGAAINQLSKAAGAELTVAPLSLETPTQDFTTGPAMDEDGLLDALNAGAEAVDTKAQILCLGEMGIGNSTVSAALAAAGIGGDGAKWVGPGTGSDAEGVALKARVVQAGLDLHAEALSDGLEIMRCLGGREFAAIMGATVTARRHRIPVMLDGFICTAAVAPLWKLVPNALDHALLSHQSAEPGHMALAKALGLDPILNLGMRLGEGSGAATALMIVRAALAAHNGMATFEEAGISA